MFTAAARAGLSGPAARRVTGCFRVALRFILSLKVSGGTQVPFPEESRGVCVCVRARAYAWLGNGSVG